MMISTHSSEALRSTGLADRDVDKESAGARTSNSQYQVSTKTAAPFPVRTWSSGSAVDRYGCLALIEAYACQCQSISVGGLKSVLYESGV